MKLDTTLNTNVPDTYDKFAKWLHWCMAFIIIYTSIAGFAMHLVVDKQAIFSFLSILNMSLATVAAPLLIIRYGWSFFRKNPTMPSSIPTLQMSIAKLVHSIMYLLMFVVFTSGYLMLEKGYALFWLIEIDNIIKHQVINQFFFDLHRFTCRTLLLIIVLHILAALKHHFIAKNKLLHLMT